MPGQRDRGPAPDGAALTYARRFALFTLVVIAGENNLDAPEIETAPKTGADQTPEPGGHKSNGLRRWPARTAHTTTALFAAQQVQARRLAAHHVLSTRVVTGT